MLDNGPLPDGFFPRFIDRPRLIGVFEIDEFAIFFGSIASSIVLSLALPDLNSGATMLGAMAFGSSLAYGYKKFKKNKPNGFTIHYLYKKGIFHPQDNKVHELTHPYLKDNRIVPYGFTKELYS